MVLATLMGVVGALLSLLHAHILEHGLYFFWTTLPELVHESNLIDPVHCAWILPVSLMLVWCLIAYLTGADLPNMKMNRWIDSVVSEGEVSPTTFGLPVFLLSLANIFGGSSIGPDAPLVFFGSAMGSWLASQLSVDPESTRCMSLCGGAATLAVFFGFPIVSAFFVLEMPHSNGYEYFEILPAALWASIVSTYTGRFLTGIKMKCDPSKTGFTCFSYKVPTSMSDIRIHTAVIYGLVAAAVAICIVFVIKKASSLVQTLKEKLGVPPQVLLCIAGLFIGCIGMVIPQTFFWGEMLLQVSLDADNGVYPVPWISEHILKGSVIPLTHVGPAAFFLIAFGKVLTISACLGAGMCGGLLFPVMVVANGVSRILFPLDDLAVLSIMGGTLASVCRVPIASLLLLVMSMRLQVDGLGEDHSVEVVGSLVTKLAISIFVASWVTSFYPYFQSRSRYAGRQKVLG